MPGVSPVQVLFAALVFEYVNVGKVLKNLRSICDTEGILAALLQMPKEGAESVTPSRFTTLKGLSSVMTLVPPLDFRIEAEQAGFSFQSEKLLTLASGKQFTLVVFRKV